MKNDILWVVSVLESSQIRVDQIDLHNRLAACVDRLTKVVEGMENENQDEP